MTLKGSLLVASPALQDPNFRRTVVLVGEHSEEGAMGVILNRPSGVTVGDAVGPLIPLTGADAVVHIGGPVQEASIIVLADFVAPERAPSIVFAHVGFLPGELESPDALGPLDAVRVFAGYAGWGPGQLDEELEQGAWVVAPALTEDVFTSDADGLWSRVLRRLGGGFRVMAAMPLDPRLN